MKKILIALFLFPSISFINAQNNETSDKRAVQNSSVDENVKVLVGSSIAIAKTAPTPYVIPRSKHHVDETTYYSYDEQVYMKMNDKPLNGVVYEKWLNGWMWWETHYKNGMKNGLNREWYKSGQLFKEERYKDGKLLSQNCWDEDGTSTECE